MAVNIRDVARACNVSPATVSRALSAKQNVLPETQRRILKVAQELGYRPFPNSELMRVKAPSIALVLSSEFGIVQRNLFYSMGLAGVAEELESCHGSFTVPPSNALEELRDIPFHLSTLRGCDGILVLYRDLSDDDIEGIKRAGVPCFVVGRRPSCPDFHFIDFDIHAGAKLAVDHLVGLGHRSIGYFGWDIADSLRGYRDGLAEHGLEEPKGWTTVWRSNKPGQPGTIDWAVLDRPKRPTAFFCHGEALAVDLITHLRSRGLEVPRDFSVVGFDDLISAGCHPPLTAVRQPIKDMASRAVRTFLEIIDGTCEGHRETVAPELIIRDSTAAPPKE